MRNSARDHRHGSVVYSRRNNFVAAIFGNVSDVFRRGIRSNVEIRNRRANQGIADAAANKQGLKARILQQTAQVLGFRPIQPSAADLHGTSLSARPRSIRAVAPQM